MKKVLLTMVCLVASIVWGVKGTAQTTTTLSDGTHSAVLVKSADGSKLTVTADGNLKDLECANGEKSFTANAVNNVFVDVNGTKTSVKAGDKYSDATSYFQASRTYSPLTIAEEYKKEAKVYSFTQKAYDAPLYVYSNDLSVWTATFTAIKSGDTPYKVGDYSIQYTTDNLSKGQYDASSYFRILKDGKTEVNENNTRILSATELESDNYVTFDTKTVLIGLASDVFKSTDDGKTYVAVSNGDVYDATASYYIGGETTYNELADADLYTEDVIVSFADYLPALMENVTSAKFTSKDANNPSMIDNSFVQALMNTQVRILDLSGVKIDAIISPFTDNEISQMTENGTFIMGKAQEIYKSNQYLETLYTPQVNAGGELKLNVFGKLSKLRYLYLSEGIETLGYKALLKNDICLSALTFPNSLKYIKELACANHFQAANAGSTGLNKVYNEETGKYDDKEVPWIETLVFPAGLLEIETDAFGSTCPKDVYFLGLDAPKVGRNAFGDNGYLSNNTLKPSAEVADGEGKNPVQVDLSTGEAVRSCYNTKNGWIMMLHYPRECSEAQAAKYTDLTRKYARIEYNSAEQKSGIYAPGKEESQLYGNTQATQNVAALKEFENIYSQGNYYGGNYSGGYYDAYTKEQYLWPSMGMIYRATVAAQNDVLWDGVTSIGDGIRKYDESFKGDGSEYIGLHQFTLVKGDAEAKSDTKEFPMDKYADGEWHTICLPFNITKGQMKEIFGRAEGDVDGEYKNIRLCKFSHVIRVADGKKDQLKLCFNDERFHKDEITDDDVVLEAHVSYMIKAKKENAVSGGKVVMTGYQMVPGNPIPTQIFGNSTGGMQTTDDDEESDFSYRFIGTYLPNIKMPQYSYFFSKTKKVFRFQGGNTGKWNPYTSVIEAPLGEADNQIFFGGDGSTNSKLHTALGEKFDEATGVDNVTIEADGEVVYTNGNVYNLNGQLVSNHGINGLQKGIYVVAGKKVMVK